MGKHRVRTLNRAEYDTTVSDTVSLRPWNVRSERSEQQHFSLDAIPVIAGKMAVRIPVHPMAMRFTVALG